MKIRKGMILLQVLVMTMVLLFICVMLAKQGLQSRMLQNKAISREEVAIDMEGGLAKVWACLNDAGYPPSGACAPTSPQLACVPAGADIDFTGVYPACRVLVNVDKD